MSWMRRHARTALSNDRFDRKCRSRSSQDQAGIKPGSSRDPYARVVFPRGDGDGWTECALGHRHWGLFGAAGLLLWNGERVLLQHRAQWSHHGGTWGLLGGARHRVETAEQAAGREAAEESGLDPRSYAVVGRFVDDHGGWSYTTVVARTELALAPSNLAAESIEVRWVPAAEVAALPLHPGFAATWEQVRALA
jgi:8-oxo-dGTP diphosphatase